MRNTLVNDHKGRAQFEVFRRVPRRAMAIGAHPDDVELGAGGTLAAWIAAGSRVALVVCSGGGAGGGDEDERRSEVEGRREREQRAAATRLGVHDLVMLGLPDGMLEDTREFRGTLVQLIRRHQPEIVLSHDAGTRDRFVHRDHRIVGQVTQDAIFPYARDRLHYPEQIESGLSPHRCDCLLLWDTDQPNTIVDVSDSEAIRNAALREHRGQLVGLFGDEKPEEWLQARGRAAAAGFPFLSGEQFRALEAPA